jgi:hypothetical protein
MKDVNRYVCILKKYKEAIGDPIRCTNQVSDSLSALMDIQFTVLWQANVLNWLCASEVLTNQNRLEWPEK